MLRILVSGIGLFLTSAAFAQINSTEALLKEMHNRYHGKFYKHITFVQLNKTYSGDTTVENSVWYEAFEYPGKLRVDYGPTVGKDGFFGSSESDKRNSL